MIFKPIRDNCVLDATSSMYPCQLNGFTKLDREFAVPTSTYFGFVVSGQYQFSRQGRSQVSLEKGMYFSSVGAFHLQGDGEIVVIEKMGYRGLQQFGGPVEDTGRLCYIDNCSTTMIVPPPRLGDPVFNLLVFPPQIRQTMHIHPTVRLGVVFEGEGECVTPGAAPLPLKPGMAFYLAEGAAHCFNSFDGKLKIVAFHPDSDVGPTDGNHPMLSRTYTKF